MLNPNLGGGALLDVGVYNIALARMIYQQDPSRICALAHLGETRVDEQTSVVLGYDSGSSASWGSPLYHWFSGATMLAAFFFATDPVTHPASARGQIVYGLVIGLVIFVVRSVGNYPDGAAFAILLGNAVSPYLDRRLIRADLSADA